MNYIDKKTGRDMEVFTTKKDGKESQYTGVEVCTKTGEWDAEIGCWFENNRLIDYDGVMCLDADVIRGLRKAGWTVPRDFEDDAE